MATPKSAEERIHRKVRKPKVTPASKKPESAVVVKKSGNNDPTRNNKRMCEGFAKFYKDPYSNEFEDDYTNIIESLISHNIENEGKSSFCIERLINLREMISNQKPDLIKEDDNKVLSGSMIEAATSAAAKLIKIYSETGDKSCYTIAENITSSFGINLQTLI